MVCIVTESIKQNVCYFVTKYTDELGGGEKKTSSTRTGGGGDHYTKGGMKPGDSIRLCVGGMYGECDVTGIVASRVVSSASPSGRTLEFVE